MAKVRTEVRCPGSAEPSEDGSGPNHHCNECGDRFPDEVIRQAGGFFPEHRRLRDARPGEEACGG